MKAALENLRTTENKHTVRLRDVLFGKRTARSGPLPHVRFRNKGLNEFQKEAVRSALASEDVSLIHGPPGTGKTTTLVELIYQAVARGDSVLASAPSNVAVDNILDKLIDTGLNVVRIGHPARVPEHLRPYTLDVIAEKTVAGRAIAGLKKRLEDVDANGAEARRLRSSIREYEKKLHDKILSQADVILGTHATTNRPLRKKAFDLAVLDEASQSVEPLSWIPLQQAKRVVFAGDTRQLPPTLHSAEAEKAGLGRTLMERLMGILPESLQTLLRVQYRMNADIMSFSSDEFYAGRLIAHDSVSEHTAKDLPGVRNTELTRTPAQYIDTAGADYRENFDALTQSYFNEGEAALIEKLYKNLIASGLAPDQIGIITPYSAQKRLLREKLGEDGPEIHTVDGFQGREKEVLLVSMVRSNDKRELGFLEEFRRLNVALTRPRRLRVVVGDSATLSRHDLYRRFLAQAEEKGQYRSAFEWMD
jgi:superfamily I DNA and/or RNA helicase